MKVEASNKFISIFDKRFRSNKSLQKKFKERTRMFEANLANPLLHDHPLKGTKDGYRAFSITGDIRVMYIIDHDIAYFLDILNPQSDILIINILASQGEALRS